MEPKCQSNVKVFEKPGYDDRAGTEQAEPFYTVYGTVRYRYRTVQYTHNHPLTQILRTHYTVLYVLYIILLYSTYWYGDVGDRIPYVGVLGREHYVLYRYWYGTLPYVHTYTGAESLSCVLTSSYCGTYHTYRCLHKRGFSQSGGGCLRFSSHVPRQLLLSFSTYFRLTERLATATVQTRAQHNGQEKIYSIQNITCTFMLPHIQCRSFHDNE